MESLVYIVFILAVFAYWTFGDYWSARAEKIREEARKLQLENDHKEFGTHEA
jgi:hypothetical protein